MRRVIPAFIIGIELSHAAWAAAPASDIVLDLDRVKVSELTAAAYSYALAEPYVLAPELVGDDRLVSARIVARPNEFRARFVQYMATLGYTVSKVSGVDQVARTPEPKAPPPPPLETLVYRPQYRDVTYLAELLKPLFDKGGFTISRKISAPAGSEATGVAPSGSAAAMVDRAGVDTLVFAGTGEDVRRLKELLPQVDTRPGEIYVEATVYEVNTGNSEGSAFELALNLLGSRVGFSTPKNSMDGASSFSIATAGVNAVFQVLSQDQRFHVLDRPSGRVMSGKSTRLSAGNQVPVLGSVAYPGQGTTPVSSIEYRDSGVILDLQPQVRGKAIELAVKNEISNFSATTTGQNQTPTLTKRAIDTTLVANDGETVILGGLVEEKDTDVDSGPSFFPEFLRAKSKAKNKIEILLVLNVKLVGGLDGSGD